MTTKLILVPDEAAASIALRVKQIKAAEAYVKEVVGRYDGLKAFEAELQRLGIQDDVRAILARTGG